MARFLAVGTARGVDFFHALVSLLEDFAPERIALDENPVAFSPLIQMRTSPALFSPAFLEQQKEITLKRNGDVGGIAALYYAVSHGLPPVHFADGVFEPLLSDTGERVGPFPYMGDLDFATHVDLMRVPVTLFKQRIPRYPGWNFDGELIHAYQVEATDEAMDRAIPQRNRFTASVLNRLLSLHPNESLAFVGHRKRFLEEAFLATPGLTDDEKAAYAPLLPEIRTESKTFVDLLRDH